MICCTPLKWVAAGTKHPVHLNKSTYLCGGDRFNELNV